MHCNKCGRDDFIIIGKENARKAVEKNTGKTNQSSLETPNRLASTTICFLFDECVYFSMLSIVDLESMGFLRYHAQLLLHDNHFILMVKNQSKAQFGERMNRIAQTYAISREQITKAVFSFPQFAGLDHSRVVADLTRVYGVSREQITKAVFTHPPFAGLDHSRVLRQAERIGKSFGFNREKISEMLLAHPPMAGYSQRRNLAAVDAFRNAAKRTGVSLTAQQAMQMYSKMFMTSPYPEKGSKKRETYFTRQKKPKLSRLGQLVEKRLKNIRRPR